MKISSTFLVWNVSSRRIGILCTEGRIDGVIKKGKMWLIPTDAMKPEDGRHKKKMDLGLRCLEKSSMVL